MPTLQHNKHITNKNNETNMSGLSSSYLEDIFIICVKWTFIKINGIYKNLEHHIYNLNIERTHV